MWITVFVFEVYSNLIQRYTYINVFWILFP